MLGIIFLIAMICLVFFCLMLEMVLNLIFRDGAPFIAWRRFVAIAEGFRLAHKIRRSSEKLEQEYQKEINGYKNGTLAGITILVVCFLSGCILDMLHVPTAFFYILFIVESIGILYLFIFKADNREYEDGILVQKCERCTIMEIHAYRRGKCDDYYATVQMSDGSRYRMIYVINGEEPEERYFSKSKGIVYYKRWPFAKCCISVVGTVSETGRG